ncbi:MAG: endonuclease/exonuclease/phosphatase family protein [bacterium]
MPQRVFFFLFGAWIFFCGFKPALEEARVVTPPYEEGQPNFQGGELIFAAWNIEWFPGQRPEASEEEKEAHIRRVASWIKERKPTVLLICEARDLASLKKMDLDYPFLACADFYRAADENAALPNQGLAWMSRLAWKEVWALDFSTLAQTPDRPARGILAAEFILPSRRCFTAYGVHLKSSWAHRKPDKLRRARAMRYLEQDWRRRGIHPQKDDVVVMGDFNTSLDDPVFADEQTLLTLFQRGFVSVTENLPREKRMTLVPKGKEKGGEFDYIFLSRSMQERPWRGEVMPVPLDLSDHSAVFLRGSAW